MSVNLFMTVQSYSFLFIPSLSFHENLLSFRQITLFFLVLRGGQTERFLERTGEIGRVVVAAERGYLRDGEFLIMVE